MYLYALLAVLAARIVVHASGMHWSALLQLGPLNWMASLGDGGLICAQALAMVSVYCVAFVGVGLLLSIVATLRNDPDLAERVARRPAWWADVTRHEQVWGGTRPYAWAALILPPSLLMLVHYRITSTYGLADPYYGELIGLVMLTAIAAGQALLPFDWAMKLMPAISRMPQRIGASSIRWVVGAVQQERDPGPADEDASR
jgi:hypothetical protein